MDPASLLTSELDGPGLAVGCIAGGLGFIYFVYGKRMQRPVPLVAGILLSIYPWFVASLAWSIAIGCVLLAVPFVIRR